MSTHIMFSLTNKKSMNTFWFYLELCIYVNLLFVFPCPGRPLDMTEILLTGP